jgi:teichuronic acid biosynthesis glycosyltransferase TuaH
VRGLPGDWSGTVVFCAGTAWDGQRLPDQHIAERLTAFSPVLYVDPPVWRDRRLTEGAGRLDLVAPALARLTPFGVPGVERPLLHRVNDRLARGRIRTALQALGASARALVLASAHDLLGAASEPLSIWYGTDDFVAGAGLTGIPRARLARQEARNLARADRVVAVSEVLAAKWRASGATVEVIPNGVDAARFVDVDRASWPADVHLEPPVAGFVGQLSDRIDVSLLEAVVESGISLLLVGPGVDASRLDRLLARPGVQWVGQKQFEDLPSYLRVVDVGLTPYADTEFNRGSFPLKTLEYLAAGRPVVATDLPAVRALDTDLVATASSPSTFAAAARAALEDARTVEAMDARRAVARRNSWDIRAADFARVLGLGATSGAGHLGTRP